MDNDNILLQKAADIYRGLRFKMKYRGVDILPAGAGNALARELLERTLEIPLELSILARSLPCLIVRHNPHP